MLKKKTSFAYKWLAKKWFPTKKKTFHAWYTWEKSPFPFLYFMTPQMSAGGSDV